jgi:hypothetical protein
MSNSLSVRRVRVQTINEDGTPDGPATYGVMAADDHLACYNDMFDSVEALEAAIDSAESILSIADIEGRHFPEADHDKIGWDNFYGKDWRISDKADEEDVEKIFLP